MTDAFEPRRTDANMTAYENQAESLAEEYSGEFVAFCRGEFAGHDQDMEALMDYIIDKFPCEPLFITKAGLEIPPVEFRSPPRIAEA